MLIRRPPLESVTVPSGSDKRAIGSADFDNSYAINTNVHGMPTGDMTIEFWGRFDEVRLEALARHSHGLTGRASHVIPYCRPPRSPLILLRAPRCPSRTPSRRCCRTRP